MNTDVRIRPVAAIDHDLRILALELDEEASRWTPSRQRLEIMRAAGQLRLVDTFVTRGIYSRGCGELWIQVGRDQLLRWEGIRRALGVVRPGDPRMTSYDVVRCARCQRPHRADLPCWRGSYASRITRHILTTKGRICWVCRGVAVSADHVLERSAGGDDTDDNLRPCCLSCNGRRAHRSNPFDQDPPVESTLPRSERWSA